MAYTLSINGAQQTVDVDGDTPLLWVLRDVLELTGTKFGCGITPVRRLHGPRRRQPDSILLNSGFPGRGKKRYHH